jgi:acyl dehydratase
MQTLPEIGETITTQVVCVRKEIRRERRYVDLQVHACGRAARPLFTGEMRLIWAA